MSSPPATAVDSVGSSAPGFRPATPDRPRIPVSFLAALTCTLCLGELGARLLELRVGASVVWADSTTATKIRRMSAIDCADVAFVGDSTVRDGVVPGEFTAADVAHRSAYNAALDAATPTLTARWTVDHVLPLLSPRLVVIGVSSASLNKWNRLGKAAWRAYLSSRAGRSDLGRALEEALWTRLAILRVRGLLLRPEELAERFTDDRDRHASEESDAGVEGLLISPDGSGLTRRRLRWRPGGPVARLVQTEMLASWTLDPVELDSLSRLVTELRRRRVVPVLVVLPVTDEYLRLHPGGRADFRLFLDEIEELGREHDVTVLDFHSAEPATHFADVHHLNEEGARSLTRNIARLLPPSPRCET
ncbi:MAG: hypothetical protein KatS3mg008_0204 [Acidimicrobiales bacterium]|nr:MAG: hypothetical protein KatS3mg008_0204 [Acidimicrobiales bacterium]